MLQVKDKSSYMGFINCAYPGRIIIKLEELEKSLKKAGVPFNCFGTLVFGLAGQLEPFNKVFQI